MNNDPHLHPVWAKHFGIEPKEMPEAPPAPITASVPQPTAHKAVVSPAQSLLPPPPAKLILDNDGWEPLVPYRPAYGAPVAVRKKLSASTYASTTVLPGDSRYPREFLTPPQQASQS